MKWNAINQHFLAEPLHPENGLIAVPGADAAGVGMDLDPAKIEKETDLNV